MDNINPDRFKKVICIDSLNDKDECLDSFIKSIKFLNTPTYLPPARQIIAIGDIHGDFDALIYCLYATNVIDIEGMWTGGDTVIVQTGDIMDDYRPIKNEFYVTGYDELLIIDYLTNLNDQAIKTGGRVAICLGNHEFVNTLPDNIYKDYIQSKTRNAWGHRRSELLQPGCILANKLACITNIVQFVGDWVFMHGGLNPDKFESYDDIEFMNENLRLYLQNELREDSRVSFVDYMMDNSSFIMNRNFGEHKIVNDYSELCQDTFTRIKQALGNDNLKMVIGHSIQPLPNSICNKQVYRIDVGMSYAFGAKISKYSRIYALRILDDVPKVLLPAYYGMALEVPDSLEDFI